MESYQFTNEKHFVKFQQRLSNKIRNGFEIIEQNNKVPYVVLSRKKNQIHFSFHLIMSISSLGLWLPFWLYDFIATYSKNDILVAVDEDGNVFEEKCFCEKNKILR